MKRLIAIFALCCALPLSAQWTIGQIGNMLASGGPFSISNNFCVSAGSATSFTTSAIDTTGATTIVVLVSVYNGALPVTITDNKGNGSATKLTAYGLSGQGAAQIAYWTSPTVGTGHTFSFSSSTGMYAAVCILPIKGATTFDAGTDSGGTFTSANSCQASSAINPGSGNHIVIAGYLSNILPSGTMTINSSYTIDGHVNYAAAINYGTAVAHLVQSPNGSLTNPTWSETGSPLALACSLASFH